jgi:hypothetical protein
VTSSSASPQPAGDVSSEASLLDAVERLAQAEQQGDIAALEQLLASDYRGYDPSGRPQDRAGVLRGYAEGGVRVTTLRQSDLRARVVGETGLVAGISAMRGQQGTEQFDFRLRFLDVYAWRDGRWQLVASQDTRLG